VRSMIRRGDDDSAPRWAEPLFGGGLKRKESGHLFRAGAVFPQVSVLIEFGLAGSFSLLLHLSITRSVPHLAEDEATGDHAHWSACFFPLCRRG